MFVRAEAPDLGRVWWTGEEHKWAYFDDNRETSETYTEWITHCPACGSSRRQQLERKNLEEVMYPA